MTVHLPTADPRDALETRQSNARGGASSQPVASRSRGASPQPGKRRLSPRLRKWLVAAHVLVGVGWFGIVAAKLVLEVVGVTTGEQGVARVGYVFLAALDRAVFPPFALATLVTGIVLSVGTAWGLFRHWWIVVKLVLTVGVIVTGVAFVGAWTDAAAADAAANVERGSAALRLIGAAVAHVLMLGAATVISVLKPWGQIGRAHEATIRRPVPARAT